MRKALTVAVLALLLVAGGCAKIGYVPDVRITPDKPLIAQDLTPYAEKRAVLMPFMEPEKEKGLGAYFEATLYDELLKSAPFAHIAHRHDVKWFGLQTRTDEAFSNAAAMAAELGYDLALLGNVERFIYGRNSESTLVVYLWAIDTTSGEMIHAQRLHVRGVVGSMPPYWDPNLNRAVHRDDILGAAANTLVRRMWVKWHEGETEDLYYEDEEAEEEDSEEEY